MQNNIEALQGTWNIVALEMDGRKLPAAMLSGAKIVVDGDRFTSLAMGATYEGTLVVDTTQNPKALDMKFTAGPEKGNTNFAIFELEGDSWKICLDTTGKGRPKEFATAAGSGHALETLERKK